MSTQTFGAQELTKLVASAKYEDHWALARHYAAHSREAAEALRNLSSYHESWQSIERGGYESKS